MLVHLLVGLLRVYQVALSPFFGRTCRFEPSCSRYAVTCLERHGVWRGCLLSLQRVCKCHPFHPGGHDLPPPPRPAPQSRLTRASLPASH